MTSNPDFSFFSKSIKLKNEIAKDLWHETNSISEFIFDNLRNNTHHHIGEQETSTPNKLIMLKTAQKVGLNIPETLVTGSKKELISFSKIYGSVITKGIQESIHFCDTDCFYTVYTEEVKNLNNLPQSFHPSLFQKKIDKSFEIRSFYLNGDFYSMAIFSQKDKKTKVDFRKYNQESPNRFIPYKIPTNICNKLKAFMDEMGLNTGSIDLVFTKDNKYIFLEVNPVGQFAMTSEPCNYYLEKRMAENLINYD